MELIYCNVNGAINIRLVTELKTNTLVMGKSRWLRNTEEEN